MKFVLSVTLCIAICSQKEAARRQEEAEKQRQEEEAEYMRRAAYISAVRKDEERVRSILEKQASQRLETAIGFNRTDALL